VFLWGLKRIWEAKMEPTIKKRPITYLSGWWVYWEKDLAFKPLDGIQWEEYSRATGKTRIISEIELPMEMAKLVAPFSVESEE
jgi:hypothetical protein